MVKTVETVKEMEEMEEMVMVQRNVPQEDLNHQDFSVDYKMVEDLVVEYQSQVFKM